MRNVLLVNSIASFLGLGVGVREAIRSVEGRGVGWGGADGACGCEMKNENSTYEFHRFLSFGSLCTSLINCMH